MKSLRERLRQFDPPPPRAKKRSGPATAALLASQPEFEALPGGALRRVVALPDLPSPAALDADAWRLLAGCEARPELPWIVFDCETTGLESGAGNLIFLVGWVEWREHDSRCVQIFLPEPSAESDMLNEFEAVLRGAGGLLSYNGKSFDLPRLQSRFALQRRGFGHADLPHMDLVHPCRRLTRGWLQDGRLGTMERALLAKERVDDLPGSEVPAVYREFLRGDERAPVGRIIEHNYRDVVRLCELAVALMAFCEGREQLPASARLQIARLHEARGNIDEARSRYALLASERGKVGGHALWRGGLLDKREKDFRSAQSRFEEYLRREPGSVRVRVELAKLLEHRLRDLDGARKLVLEALDALEAAEFLGGGTRTRDERRALRHRLLRLDRKCAAHP